MANIDKKAFGKFIAERRSHIMGVHSQPLLAKKLKVNKATIGKIETGDRLPSYSLFIDLAEALNMSPTELMDVLACKAKQKENLRFLQIPDFLTEDDQKRFRRICQTFAT